MHNHWFTIRNYWRELRADISGSKITQAFTFQKNECSFILLAGRDRYRVDYSGNSELPYCTLTHRLNIPKRRVQLFEALEGAEILDIRMVPGDRILHWELDRNRHLYFEFFGGKPNVFLADHDGNILDTFKEYNRSDRLNFRDFSGMPYPLPEDFSERFHREFRENERKSVSNILAAILPHWITLLSREALFRIGIDSAIQGIDLPDGQRRELEGVTRTIYEELETPDTYISTLPDPQFSLIALRHASDADWDLHLPIQEAYPKYVGVFYRGRKFRELRKRLRQSLGNRLEREQRKLEKQRDDLKAFESPDQYRKTGDLLMANLQNITQGQDEVELDDIISGDGMVTVSLDPGKTPVENAQAYYEQAKKAERGRTQLQKQLQEAENRLSAIQYLYDQLEEVTDLKELEEIESEAGQLGLSVGQPRKSSEPQTRVPYTEFTSPDGWRVLVGRGARDNDELTFHVANKDDFWFHAESVPGSHVIAVADNKNLEKPPRATIEFAAGLAAGYSQAKHSGLVPVVYTKRKYVTKPRDAGPGLVRYQFEESVIVEPKHP